MKKLKLTERLGFAQLFVLIGMLLVAISLPIATKLVQENQENRSNASGSGAGGSCTISTAKCENGQMYFCTKDKWVTAATCESKKCASSGKACAAVNASAGCSGGYSNGAYKCSGSVKYKCDDGTWVNSQTCSYGCSGNSCASKPAAPSGCSSSACGKCDSSSSCADAGCLWGYNGSSKMYCYSKSSSVPTMTPAPTVVSTIKKSLNSTCEFHTECESGTCKDSRCVPDNTYCAVDGSIVASGNTICKDGKVNTCINGSLKSSSETCAGVPGNGCTSPSQCAGNVCKDWHCLASNNDCWKDGVIITNGSSTCVQRTIYKCVNGGLSEGAGCGIVGGPCFSPNECSTGICTAYNRCFSSVNDCYDKGVFIKNNNSICIRGVLNKCINGTTDTSGSCKGSTGDECSNPNQCTGNVCKEWRCLANNDDCYSTLAGKVVTNGTSVCAEGKTYKCVNGDFLKPPVNGCSSNVAECTPNGLTQCVDSGQIQQCVLGKWVNASKCTSGKCSISGTGCEAAAGVCTSAGGTCRPLCETSEVKYAAGKSECGTNNCCQKINASSTTCNSTKIGQKKCWQNTVTNKYEVLECKKTGTSDNDGSDIYAYVQVKECTSGCTTSGTTASCNGSQSDYCTSGSYKRNVGNSLCFSDGMRKCILEDSWSSSVTCSDGKICKNTGGEGVTGSANCVDLTDADKICTSGSSTRKEGKYLCVNGTRNECVMGATGAKWNSANSRCDSGYKCLNTTDSAKCVQCLVDADCSSSGKSCVNNSCGGSGSGSGGGGGTTSGGETSVPATAIALDPTTVSLAVGATKAITATLTPSNSTDSIVWTSSNNAVATVTTKGIITGVGVGTATITAKTSSGKTATVVVTITAGTTGSAQVSFKFAFAGIKSNAACISSLGDLTVEVANVPTNVSETLATGFAKLDDDQKDSKENQIFQVTALPLDATKFANVNTFNYVKIKGPFHLKRRMCQDGQSLKLSETTTCSIDLTDNDTIYKFYEYTLLAGDTDQNGVINSIDFSYVKTRFDAAADVYCGREGDLNMDGVVNALDINLVKEALSSRDDE